MTELWQLYDDQGRALKGQGAVKGDIFSRGLLHGAAHVWIWRVVNGESEILLQKRSATKETWPNAYDISAAGHIDVGEEPLTAGMRETQEEIGLEVNESSLKLINIQRAYLIAPNGAIENEFQWLYLFKLSEDFKFDFREAEVAALEWRPLTAFDLETRAKTSDKYVPHGELYYKTVIEAIKAELATQK